MSWTVIVFDKTGQVALEIEGLRTETLAMIMAASMTKQKCRVLVHSGEPKSGALFEKNGRALSRVQP